ncbi:hypothetical protein HID58_016541, partial [Brassica napus]
FQESDNEKQQHQHHHEPRCLETLPQELIIHESSRERNVENRDNKTYLIAKALNMERTNSTVPGDYFDCNICLENAQDPLPLIYLNVKECPVCDGKVTDTEHFRIGLQALAQGDEFGLSNIVFVNVLIKKKKA